MKRVLATILLTALVATLAGLGNAQSPAAAKPTTKPLTEVQWKDLQILLLEQRLLEQQKQMLDQQVNAFIVEACAAAGFPKGECTIDPQTRTIKRVEVKKP